MGKIAVSTPCGSRWSNEEISQLIAMRRQGASFGNIAIAMRKTQRAVEQKYRKVVPTNAPKKKIADVEMTEEMKIKLLSAVARRKPTFWAEVAREVGDGVMPGQCEEIYTKEIWRSS